MIDTTFEVGQRYRNPSGEYLIVEIEGMWATVEYESGQIKRHLLSALKIHWENEQAAAAAAPPAPATRATRSRAAKSPFPIEETNRLISRIINSGTKAGEEYLTRETIVAALMADPRGGALIEAAHKGLFYRTPEWIAGSMIDQFNKDLMRRASPVFNKFEREKIDNVWAFRPA